jgi:hypothetical protein
MLHKLGAFSDPLLDRQITAIVDAINELTLVNPTTGTKYLVKPGVDPTTGDPALTLTEVQ